MRALCVLSHRHSSSVCFFFVSILSAAGTAGGVSQAQVVADDLPRSGEATRGGDPERAEGRQSFQLTSSPCATSSRQPLCSERTPQGGPSARPSEFLPNAFVYWVISGSGTTNTICSTGLTLDHQTYHKKCQIKSNFDPDIMISMEVRHLMRVNYK